MSIVGGLVCFDRSKCTGCNACVRACPSGAQTVYGETQSVDQILSRVEEDGVFYTRSGGGLTLSGGEALAQPDFALALLREAVIPGFNDTEEDILGIREMIPRKANIRYEALTYHRMGQPKYGYLGRRYELEGVKADEAFMKRLNIMLKSYEK